MNFRNLIVGTMASVFLALFSCGVEAVNTEDASLLPAENYSESEGDALTQAQIATLRDAISGDYENKSGFATIFISKINFSKDGKVAVTEECTVCDMGPGDSTGTYNISYTSLKLDLTNTFSKQKSTRKFTYVVVKSTNGKKTLYLREVGGTVRKFETVVVKPPVVIWPSSATRVTAENKGGGFGPQPPPGSDCYGQAFYDLDLVTGTLKYQVCEFVNWSTAFKWNSGSIVLTAQQISNILAVGKAFKATTSNACGADKPVLQVTAFSGTASKVFGDAFYACWKEPGVTYVTNIDAMFSAIAPLVPKPQTNIWPANVSRVLVEDKGGGFTPPAPVGSQCAYGSASYDLDVSSGILTFTKCEFVDWNTPFTLKKGTKLFSPQEVAKVLTAGTQLKLSTQEICGADKPVLKVTAFLGSTPVVFGDDFYACAKEPGVKYVSNIEVMFDAVGAILVP